MKNIILALLALAFIACKDNEFEAMGVFESDEILISSEIGGKIIEFSKNEGDNLKKGELIAQIDTQTQELNILKINEQIKALKSSLRDVGTQLAPLKEQITFAKAESNRLQNLYKNGATTKQKLDSTKSNLAFLQKEYSAKEESIKLANNQINAQISALNIEIKLLQNSIQKAKIYTPLDSILLEKYAFGGEIASPAKPLFKIADMKNIYLNAYFSNENITQIKLGDEVNILVDFGKEEKIYRGIIANIAQNAEFTPKNIMTKNERENLVYAVKIKVENDGFLKLGGYGSVKFGEIK